MAKSGTSRQFDPRSWPLGTRLTLVVIGLVTLTLVGVILSNIWAVRTTLAPQIRQDFESEAVNLRELVQLFFQEKITELQVLALANALQNPVLEHNAAYTGSPEEIVTQLQSLDIAWLAAADDDPVVATILSDNPAVNPATARLVNFLQTSPYHTQLYLTDRYGATVAATTRPLDYYQADEEWWQVAWNEGQGAVYISDPKFDETAGVTAFLMAIPLVDQETGQVMGILRSTLVADELFNLVREARFRQTGQAILYNRAGRVLFNPAVDVAEETPRLPKDVWQTVMDEESGSQEIPNPAGSGDLIFGHASFREADFDPEVMTAKNQAAAAVARLGWIVGVQQRAEEAFATIDTLVRVGPVVGLIALVLASLVAIVTAGAVTRPLVALSDAADQIGTGNLDVPLPPPGRTEIGRLAGSFRYMVAHLRQLIDSLADRTKHLETVAILSEHLSRILSLEELMAEVVNQIQDWFDYYHAHIYLLDDTQQKLVVAAGTGPAGEKMKAGGHSIPREAQTSLVARAARTAEIVRVDNVREAEDWLPNPLLPDTYSEMAVPIVLDEEVVGVLDVQEDRIGGLDESDAALLYSLANQVAVAIRNARLFEEAQTALAEAHAAQQQYVEQAWDPARIARRGIGQVQFNLAAATSLSEVDITKVEQQALAKKELTVIPLNGGEDTQEGEATSALVAPITFQQVPIGTVQLHGITSERKWTEGELALINAVVDQVAQVAENLRLLDESQERAARERLVGRVSDKLRRAPDVESLMKTAVDEISRILGPDRTFVRFGTETELAGAGPAADDDRGNDATPPAGAVQSDSSEEPPLDPASGNGQGETS